MPKVVIKNENFTSFGGIYHIIDVFSKLGFKNLPNLYWANVEVAAKHSAMEVFFGSLFFSYLCGGECLGDINTLTGPLNTWMLFV